MARIAFRAIRQRRRFFEQAADKIKSELGATIDRVVKPRFLKAHNDVVANWQHKPTFAAIKDISPSGISLYVEAVGPNAKYWIWTNEGTRPHLITAKHAPMLRFQTNYTPKTAPGSPPSFGGPGVKSGPWRSTKSVHHPGTEARNFSEQIREDNAQWFSNTMASEWRRIIRGL